MFMITILNNEFIQYIYLEIIRHKIIEDLDGS